MGRRRDREFCRAAHQHGTGRAVRHPHEDGIMRGCPVRVALYPLPVVSVRVACPVCLRAEICRADSRRRLCNVPDGVAVSYFLFPADIPFLGTYQVSGEVENMIVLQSYISTLVLMCLTMGIVFEIPILSWLFAKLGFLTADFMRRYRKHAIVIILIVAAVITPTSDVFTLSLVTLPMWVLYEASILVVNRAASKKAVDR